MPITSRLARAGTILAGLAFIVLWTAAGAAAKTIPFDLRVLTADGEIIAEQIQYGGPTTVNASRKADCFGEDNPSSNGSHEIGGRNALTPLVAAPGLELLLTDAFADDGFGLGVCGINGHETEGFSYWYFAANHLPGETGPDLTQVGAGQSVLWYLTSGTESGFPVELELDAPARAKRGVTVRVFEYTTGGERVPAEGATVKGGLERATTDADGFARIGMPADGASLRAVRPADGAIPSNREFVCNSEVEPDCPAADGELYVGSPVRDVIPAGKGNDVVRSRAGDDKVKLRAGGADTVKCGAGRDVVVLAKGDDDDRLRKCEVTRRV